MVMDTKEKLVQLIKKASYECDEGTRDLYDMREVADGIADFLIANGVTVQEHGYLETVVEVKDNTVCGNGVRIEYKRCSCCKNPVKFFEDDFCGSCGAKLDLSQPLKGE